VPDQRTGFDRRYRDRSRTKIDLDNPVKCLLDYLVRLGVIVDDGPAFVQRIVLEWGDAPEGVRLILAPLEGK